MSLVAHRFGRVEFRMLVLFLFFSTLLACRKLQMVEICKVHIHELRSKEVHCPTVALAIAKIKILSQVSCFSVLWVVSSENNSS